MVTVATARQSVSQARQSISQAKQQIQQEKQKIPRTTQEQLRQQTGLEGRKFRQDLIKARRKIVSAEENIQSYETQVNQYETNVNKYVRTEEGRLQYAKEQNLTPTPVYGRVVKGGTIEVIGQKYQTPYGEVTDFSQKRRLEFQQRKLGAIESAEAAAVGSSLGITSPKKLKQAGINVQEFLKGKAITVKETVGSVKKGDVIQVTPDKSQIEITSVSPQVVTPPPVPDTSRIQVVRRKGEIYSAGLGAYIKPSEASGQATGFIREPTSQERLMIEAKARAGSFSNFGKKVERGIDWMMNVTPAERVIKDKQAAERSAKAAAEKLEKFKQTGEAVGVFGSNMTSQYVIKGKYSPFMLAAGATLKTAEKVAEKVAPKDDSFWNQPAGLSRTEVKESLSTLYAFAAFEPLMRTATQQTVIQQQEMVWVRMKDGTLRLMSKQQAKAMGLKALSDTEKVRAALTDTVRTGKTVKILSFKEKAERARLLYTSARPEKKKVILKLIEQQYGKSFVRQVFPNQVGAKALGVVKPATSKTVQVVKTTPVSSVWAGTGAYERTTGVVSRLQPAQLKGIMIPETAAAMLAKQKLQQIQFIKPAQETKLESRTKVALDVKTAQDIKIAQDTATSTNQLSGLDTAQTPSFKFDTIQAPQTATQQTTAQVQRARQEESFARRGRGIKIPLIRGGGQQQRIKLLQDEATKRKLTVFGRRFGRDIQIAKVGSRAAAKRKLTSFLTGTLGRSGFVLENGKKIDIGLRGGQFRRAKSDPLRVVQKARFSLGTRSEVTEIMGFKRRKSRRKRNAFF